MRNGDDGGGGEWEGWRDDGKKDRLRERERERGGVLCHCV